MRESTSSPTASTIALSCTWVYFFPSPNLIHTDTVAQLECEALSLPWLVINPPGKWSTLSCRFGFSAQHPNNDNLAPFCAISKHGHTSDSPQTHSITIEFPSKVAIKSCPTHSRQ